MSSIDSTTQKFQILGLQAAFMGLGGVIFLSLGGFQADLNWRNGYAAKLVFIFAFIAFVVMLRWK